MIKNYSESLNKLQKAIIKDLINIHGETNFGHIYHYITEYIEEHKVFKVYFYNLTITEIGKFIFEILVDYNLEWYITDCYKEVDVDDIIDLSTIVTDKDKLKHFIDNMDSNEEAHDTLLFKRDDYINLKLKKWKIK